MGSIFASRTTKTVEIPFDQPNTVTVRQLTGKQLGKAQQAFWFDLAERSKGQATLQKDLADVRAAIAGPAVDESDEEKRAAKEAQRKAVEAAQADPLNGFDPATLVQLGVTAWTYTEAVPLEPTTIDDLSDEALTFIATEVLRLTKPALFKSAEERKADQKND